MTTSILLPGDLRVRVLRDGPVGDGFVLYWMTGFRRLSWNPALDRALRMGEVAPTAPAHLSSPCGWGIGGRAFGIIVSASTGWRSMPTRLPGVADRILSLPRARSGRRSGASGSAHGACGVVVADDAPVFFFRACGRPPRRAPDVGWRRVDGNGLSHWPKLGATSRRPIRSAGTCRSAFRLGSTGTLIPIRLGLSWIGGGSGPHVASRESRLLGIQPSSPEPTRLAQALGAGPDRALGLQRPRRTSG
jgi:hypothetical protein